MISFSLTKLHFTLRSRPKMKKRKLAIEICISWIRYKRWESGRKNWDRVTVRCVIGKNPKGKLCSSKKEKKMQTKDWHCSKRDKTLKDAI